MTANEQKPLTIVVIDDDQQNVKLIRTALQQPGLEILGFTDPDEGLRVALRRRPVAALVDLVMPKLGGMDVLSRILNEQPDANVILMTGQYSTETAVEAIQRGACDYLEKPLALPKLQQRVQGLLEDARRRDKDVALENELLRQSQFEGVVGRSPLMLQMFSQVRRIAPHFRTVLVTGPTGSGKELVARALHRLSPVAEKTFATCNCAAVVETLFESELFGHVKGAFTGAVQDKLGLFEYANGGVVFLDEIGDMPLPAQAKMLRVLQNQEVQRVGSPQTRKVDVRIIAATHHDLRRLVNEKRFREDLYYRLCAVEIRVPSLAERREDLPLLIRHFLETCARQYHKPIPSLTPRAATLLSRYSWPGNVRELENALASALMMTGDDVIDIRDFPESVVSGSMRSSHEQTDFLTLDEVQRRHILRVLELTGGKKAATAEILGIGRTSLYRFLKDMGVEQSEEVMEETNS